MCGIFGWIKFRGRFGRDEVDNARAATSMLAHRGPNAEGFWHDGRLFLGHRRLSIIDLSDSANQPFRCADSNALLSFNGEIYNFVELRSQFDNTVPSFVTQSDTEVLYRALQAWGPAALHRFDGMFAGAYHDTDADQHLLFRDALGQKPLYYYEYPDGLIYASELRPILSLNGFSWKIDTPSFYRFLSNGYYGWDTSPIVGIKKLPPGHYLKIEKSQTNLVRWWHSVPGADPLQIDPDQAVETTAQLLDDACRKVLRSDVPVGVFLSGGIDSSLVLAHCRAFDPTLRSYSVGMPERDYDESEKARSVAKLVGSSSHHELHIGAAELRECLEVVLQKMDEPHGDPGFINMFALSRVAKPEITVALAGDGADELFCGYLPFKALGGVPLMNALPGFSATWMRRIAEFLPSSDTYLGFKFKALSWLNGFPADASKRANLWLSTLPAEALSRLMACNGHTDLSRNGRGGFFDFPGEVYDATASLSHSDQLSYFYQQVFLPEFVCHHTDRAAMMNGMEVRAPFLSPALIAFANRLPAAIRLRDGVTKWPLRRMLAQRGFPEEIVRQRKQGFTLPLARWQRQDLRDDVLALRDRPDALDGVIAVDSLRGLIDDHLEGRNNNYRLIHCLMVFNAWRLRYPALEFS
jgi:asparagine synthase (glutamine-hydrolysing)